ncbi:hypothetical protein [Burkholderia ubonensis]|nr:hypothetical protein [Burkholderia ubonensis]
MVIVERLVQHPSIELKLYDRAAHRQGALGLSVIGPRWPEMMV